MSNREISELEREIADLAARLNAPRRNAAPQPVPDYRIATLSGEVTLLDLFGGKQRLLAIHDMGQGCRYCTLWADAFNGLPEHIEIRHVRGAAVAGPAPAPARFLRFRYPQSL